MEKNRSTHSKKSKTATFTSVEKQSIFGLSLVLFFRMFGVFLVFPVFSVMAMDLKGATPITIGLALGAYGLTQALFQIPFGYWSDRFGRKHVIAIGIFIFMVGSFLSSISTHIYGMMLGRLLQGVGAVSGALFALIADLTRPEVRTRATAGLGSSIGVALGCAFFLAPLLSGWFSIQGLFTVITIVAAMSLLVLWWIVPTPPVTIPQMPSTSWQSLKQVIQQRNLATIQIGSFVSSAGLSATFFILPKLLIEHHFKKSELWYIYLPMLITGILVMIPAAIFAETRHRFKEVMIIGALMMMGAFLLLWTGYHTQQWIISLVGAFLLFMGFNVFEPIFPSLVTKLSDPAIKGTASGVNNFFQFMGQFAGAALAGIFYHSNPPVLFTLLILMVSVFLYRLYRSQYRFEAKSSHATESQH